MTEPQNTSGAEQATGATDAQIEAAAERLYDFMNFRVLTEIDGKVVKAWSVANQAKYREIAYRCAECLVPPGHVVVPASAVVTADARAAIGPAVDVAEAARDLFSYDDLSLPVDPGVCELCGNGIEDPSRMNAARQRVDLAMHGLTDADLATLRA